MQRLRFLPIEASPPNGGARASGSAPSLAVVQKDDAPALNLAEAIRLRLRYRGVERELHPSVRRARRPLSNRAHPTSYLG